MRQPSKPKRKTTGPAPSPRPETGKKRTAVKNAGTQASASAEARQRLLIRILETLNRTVDIKQLTHDILEMIKEHSGVEALGLRLREGEDFPYVDIIGLSAVYLKDKGTLCARGPGGEILRDGVGYPVLECLCGAVLQGRTDQALPVFTPGGSFWTNDLAPFAASTPAASLPSRMRTRCLSEDYRSMALIPLRSGKDIVGLLQLNDKRPGCFTLEVVRFLERIGSSIAITVARQKSLEALKASQDLLRAVISGTSDAVYVKDIQGRYLLFNDAAAQIIGKAALGAGGREEPLLFASDQKSVDFDRDLATVEGGQTVTVEESIKTRSGKTRTYLSTKGPLLDERGRVSGMFTIAHDFTERKEMEEALKESHGRYLGFFENAPVGMFHSLPEGCLLRVNRAAASMLGYDSAGEMVATIKSVPDQLYFHPEKRHDLIRKILEHDGWVFAENEMRRKDGTSIIAKLSLRRVLEPDGTLAYIEGFAEDITERRRAEEALRESEERYRTMMEQAADAVFMHDETGRIMDVNREACQSLGYSREELLSKSMGDIDPEAIQTKKHELWGKVLEGEQFTFESIYIRKDGSFVPVEVTLGSVRLPLGPAILGIVRDITERKQAEEMLQKTERDYRMLAENSPDLIARFDTRLRHLYVNPAAARVGKLSGSEYIGITIAESGVSEPLATTWEQRIRQVLKTSKMMDMVDAFPTPEGIRYFHTRLVPEMAPDGSVRSVLSIARDITERKQVEDALRESEERFKGLFDDAVLGLYRTTPDGKILMANPAMCRMLGYDSFKELQKRNLEEDGFNPGYPRERFKKEIEAKGVIIGLEASWDLRGGGRIFVSESARAIKDDSGRVLYYEGSVEDITERHRALEALRESEEKFKNLSEQSPNMIFINRKGKVVYANEVCEQTMGYSRGELCSPDFDFQRLLAPESENAVRASFASHLAGREVPPYETSLITKDGRRIEAVLTTKLIDFENEKAILGILTDITEQKRIQKALQQGEERFRQLVENMSSGVAVYEARDDGRDFIFKDFNRAAERIEGVARQDILGRSVLDAFPGVADLGLFEVFRRVWQTGEPEHLPAGVYQDQRIVGWRENYVYRLPSGEVVAVYDDITERRRAEILERAVYEIARAAEEVKSLDDLFRSVHLIIKGLMPAANFLIALYDEKENLLDFPYYVDEIDSVPPSRKPGKGLTGYVLRTGKTLLCDTAQAEELSRDGEAEKLGIPSSCWLGVPLKARNKIIGVIALDHYSDPKAYGEREKQVLEYVSGQVANAIVRKQAEEAVRSLNIELEERVRRRTALLEAANRELEAFAYSVSHDLRAPLRTIDGFAQALEEELHGRIEDRTLHYLNRVRAASRDMERLISDLLKLSRVTRAEMSYTSVHLSIIVEKLASELQAAHPVRRVEWVIAPGVKVDGDPQQLESVLRNLVGNAFKFTAKHASARIEFGVQDRGGQKVYFVRDDGAGFDMVYADKLFSVFQRLHKAEDFEGTGVGLAIVQRIIHRHGGRVWAEGLVEKGATFYFSLAPGNPPPPEQA